MLDDPVDVPATDPALSRRQFLQLLLAAGGAVALPALWAKPVVEAATVPTTDLLSNPAGAPTGLTATRQNDGSIALTWVDHASNEDGYEIKYSDDLAFGETTPMPGTFTGTAISGAGVNGQGAFVFTSAVHAYTLPTTLYFKVRAYHAGPNRYYSTIYSSYSVAVSLAVN